MDRDRDVLIWGEASAGSGSKYLSGQFVGNSVFCAQTSSGNQPRALQAQSSTDLWDLFFAAVETGIFKCIHTTNIVYPDYILQFSSNAMLKMNFNHALTREDCKYCPNMS